MKSSKVPTKKLMPREQRRSEVFAAARKVFLEHGFGGASMRSIAAEAGVNEALLYRICHSKLELFEEAVAGPLEEAVNRSVVASSTPSIRDPQPTDVRGRTNVFVEDLLHAMREIAPLLMAVLLTDREAGNHFYQNRFEPSLKRIVLLVRDALPLWDHQEFDPDLLVRVVFGMCWIFAIDSRYGGKPAAELSALAPKLVQILFDGISNREP